MVKITGGEISGLKFIRLGGFDGGLCDFLVITGVG